jgi:hypothetical protein
MNGDTSSDRDRWRGSPRRARVLAVVPGIALLTAACSGNSVVGLAAEDHSASREDGIMNETTGGWQRWCRVWPRRAGVLAVTAGIVLLAACGGSPSSASDTGASSQYQQNLAFTQCMRSHGLPDFPDPNANGHGFGNQQQQQQEESNPHLGTAYNDCHHLLPSPPSSSRKKVIPSQTQLVRFSQCMRSHGVPDYPDPNPNASIRTELAQLGINPDSPPFQATLRTCDRLVPLGGGS